VKAAADPGELLALYQRALPEVYGYLLDRCRDRETAEDLTSETFLAAVRAVDVPSAPQLSVPWLLGVARHKLVDHWRRRARDDRLLDALSDSPAVEDPWDAQLSSLVAADVLERLGEHHQIVLTLRYVDGLSVPEVAVLVERTVHATEALLVRARIAFRKLYEKGADGA
jgi:RNA polymerase sigma-70 factor (ECF subfamily)